MTTLNSRTGATGVLHESLEWRSLRVEKLINERYRCQQCNGYNPRCHVHHRKPVRMFPHLALDYGNLVTLCPGCHESLHNVARSPLLMQLVQEIAKPEFITARRLDFGAVPIQLGLSLDEPAANDEWTLDPPAAIAADSS